MLVKTQDHPQFKLSNFEGPLAFLLYLVQKHELDVTEVPLREIAEQYLQHLQKHQETRVEEGAEFIGTAAWLLWLKSKLLLPSHEQPDSLFGEEGDSPFVIIPQLVEYLQFKQIAQELAERQQQQSAFYVRGCDEPQELKKVSGVEHISLQDLCGVFRQALQKAQTERGMISEEMWRVSDKIESMRQALKRGIVEIPGLFASQSCREELIVLFLAILEMMKLGELCVVKEAAAGCICLIPSKERSHAQRN